MRLLKSLIGITFLLGGAFFLYQNHVINPEPMTLWLYYGYEVQLKLTEIIAITFFAGTIIGLLISAIQIISHKTEIMTLKSSRKKLQVELDTLRNQAIADDIDIKDSIDTPKL